MTPAGSNRIYVFRLGHLQIVVVDSCKFVSLVATLIIPGVGRLDLIFHLLIHLYWELGHRDLLGIGWHIWCWESYTIFSFFGCIGRRSMTTRASYVVSGSTACFSSGPSSCVAPCLLLSTVLPITSPPTLCVLVCFTIALWQHWRSSALVFPVT